MIKKIVLLRSFGSLDIFDVTTKKLEKLNLYIAIFVSVGGFIAILILVAVQSPQRKSLWKKAGPSQLAPPIKKAALRICHRHLHVL